MNKYLSFTINIKKKHIYIKILPQQIKNELFTKKFNII
jgi:hypothetical protein